MAKSSKYPRIDFDAALDFVKELDKNFSANTISYEEVEQMLGVKTNATAKFSKNVSTAEQFKLIETAGKTIQIAALARKILHPTSDNDEDVMKLKISSFMSSPLYSTLFDRFLKTGLPTEGVLANILLNEYGILKSVKNTAAKNFLKSLDELGLMQDGVLKQVSVDEDSVKGSEGSDNEGQEAANLQGIGTHGEEYVSLVLPLMQGQAVLKVPRESLESTEKLKFLKTLINANLDAFINRNTINSKD
ncbi:hypothetical protein [Levilactobacillus enshiensis]|uniref:hypothetical protein n=1 Tax=Levilactobacillus enshiensis TaxID=2590213 RepID=UPI00117A1085|nr:hypothetical protein [Levilactobacillus enshiensis]